MKHTNRLIALIILFGVILSSCDSIVTANGKVLDSQTKLPVDSVSVSLGVIANTFTDSNGVFHLKKFLQGARYKEHLLFEKEGYQPLYIYNKSHNDVDVLLKKEAASFSPAIQKHWIKWFYYFNLWVLTPLSVFTFFFVIVKRRLRIKWAWLLGLLLLNFKILISYLDASIVDFSAINGPLFLAHYNSHPFAVQVALPLATVLFWILFFTKRELLLKHSASDPNG